MRLSHLSTEYVHVPVTASKAGQPYDPTGDTVKMAFTVGDPAVGDWHGASWIVEGSIPTAICLVGPANGGVVLAAGVYTIWVQIGDNPEVPFLASGLLIIY